ncbi:AlpA family phage regulatory protein [Burkholderiaceae bacterium DAT-1]|nr:AlpA family phage regulatory protein [Burkholderiaceae bacterium DAT-1]
MSLLPFLEADVRKQRAELPAEGFVRLTQIIGPGGPIPVSKSTWWAGVKSGRYPQSVKLGPRITAWRVSDIRALLQVDEGVAND